MNWNFQRLSREEARAYMERSEQPSIAPESVRKLDFAAFEARVLALKLATTMTNEEVSKAYDLLRAKVG